MPPPANDSKGSGSTQARRRIVSGARQHFLAHGFRNVTMDDVAHELGMSKKTVYAHFTSKVELLRAVIRDKFRELNATLEAVTPRANSDFFGTLHKLLAVVQYHAQEIHPAFVRDIRREAPEIFQLVERLRHEAIQLHFGRLFAAGQRAGAIRKDFRAELLVEILLGVTQVIVNPVKLAEFKLTPEDGLQVATSVIFEGVLTMKGRQRR